jgi:hypothetical protein
MAEIKFEHSLTYGQQQTSISKIVCKSAHVLDHKNTTELLYLSATIFFIGYLSATIGSHPILSEYDY